MFELRLVHPPADRASLDEALARATAGLEGAEWRVVARVDSPVPGRRGAVELFVHARRA